MLLNSQTSAEIPKYRSVYSLYLLPYSLVYERTTEFPIERNPEIIRCSISINKYSLLLWFDSVYLHCMSFTIMYSSAFESSFLEYALQMTKASNSSHEWWNILFKRSVKETGTPRCSQISVDNTMRHQSIF